MKRFVAVLSLFLILIVPVVHSAMEYEDILLNDIAVNISKYKGTTLTLRLRLKYLDAVFNKLVFYDRKNTDIEFDVETAMKDKKDGNAFLNLHNGMEYLVTFTINDIGKMGVLIGELGEFVPLALLRLPEGGG